MICSSDSQEEKKGSVYFINKSTIITVKKG